MSETQNVQAALSYLRQGWSVVPAMPSGKRPIIRWREFQHRLPSEANIREWFGRWPEANLSVVTGALSGIVVLDIDPNHQGEASLDILEARNGKLPETVESITGGGGRHLYFLHPGFDVHNRAGLAPGLDLRGDGGVIIVPPSTHPSGRLYRWRKGHSPCDSALAPLPDWLLRPRFEQDGAIGHPLAYWRRLVKDGVAEGRRNATIASFTGHLLWHEVDFDVIMELMLAWNQTRCRPPLTDEEVIRTVRSIEQTHRVRTPAR